MQKPALPGIPSDCGWFYTLLQAVHMACMATVCLYWASITAAVNYKCRPNTDMKTASISGSHANASTVRHSTRLWLVLHTSPGTTHGLDGHSRPVMGQYNDRWLPQQVHASRIHVFNHNTNIRREIVPNFGLLSANIPASRAEFQLPTLLPDHVNPM